MKASDNDEWLNEFLENIPGSDQYGERIEEIRQEFFNADSLIAVMPMEHHQQAERLVRKVIEDLQRLLPRDGEDISCYNPCAIDASILSLVEVRTLLGRANEASEIHARLAKRKIHITQLEIDAMLLNLATQVREHGFTRVVGIANGGLPISRPLAALLDLPHESVRISHYDGKVLRETPIIEGQLSQSQGCLIVDDLIDGGWTYRTFDQHFGFRGNAMAVLFWNPTGPKPDFYVTEKPDAWVVFPWETE
jgi:hypoxanthine phosphoribosyltransferase